MADDGERFVTESDHDRHEGWAVTTHPDMDSSTGAVERPGLEPG